jgi:hypothetical protein
VKRGPFLQIRGAQPLVKGKPTLLNGAVALTTQKIQFKIDFLQFELCRLSVYISSRTLKPSSSLDLGRENLGI